MQKAGKASSMKVQAAAAGVSAPYGTMDPQGVPNYMGGLISN